MHSCTRTLEMIFFICFLSVDSFKARVLHQQAMCYVHVLRLRSTFAETACILFGAWVGQTKPRRPSQNRQTSSHLLCWHKGRPPIGLLLAKTSCFRLDCLSHLLELPHYRSCGSYPVRQHVSVGPFSILGALKGGAKRTENNPEQKLKISLIFIPINNAKCTVHDGNKSLVCRTFHTSDSADVPNKAFETSAGKLFPESSLGTRRFERRTDVNPCVTFNMYSWHIFDSRFS